MKTFLKQCTEWATNLERNLFEHTRLKLTAIFALIMATVIIIFSVALYNVIAKNIRVRLNAPRPPATVFSVMPEARIPLEMQKLVRQEILSDIKGNLILFDVFLFMLVSVIGYILAGKALEPAQKAYERQKRFVADASHDLRTPLAAMQSEIEIALRGKTDTGHFRSVLTSNLEEVQTMSRLVTDLLLLVRIDAGTEKLVQEPISVSEVVSSIVKKVQSEADKKGLILSQDIVEGEILGSRTLIERALTNIIENAVAYTKTGAIALKGILKDKEYQVTVSDTGVGISKEELPRVFDRFYRGEQARSNASNSGLGLAIAKEIITAHHGLIAIESVSEQGTIVTVRLPSVENK